MQIQIQNLSKSFGATPVLRDISLTIASRELFFLLGPSGCGKTTLLRLIAGFYQADAGEVLFGGRAMNRVPPHERNTGMVFQNYALWPHMTVAENVAYGLEVRKVPADERRRRVAEALAGVRMEAYADRSPNALSGGQQQRVALARALVVRPDVLLLDEPLSNLDARLRLEMRDEIRRIHAETRITTIYVTHDQKEALSLAGRMAVLREGRVEQLDAPRAVYRNPANRFVADFLGETNWIEGVAEADRDRLRVETASGRFELPLREGFGNRTPVWLGFRPESAVLDPGAAGTNSFDVGLLQANYLGETEELVVESGSCRWKLFVRPDERSFAEGETLRVRLRPEDLLLLPRPSAG